MPPLVRRRSAPLLCALAALATPAAAQTPDTARAAVALPEVVVRADRFDAPGRAAPHARSVAVRSAAARAFEPPLTLGAVVRGLPGVWVSDRANAALGERLVVRGLGARTAFGVRGVYALLDGVPLTMPDGQASLDVVEPAAVTRTDALRGPAGALWGNGSAGVVAFSTAPEAGRAPSADARAFGGAYGLRAFDVRAASGAGDRAASGYVSHARADGYRRYGRFERTRAGFTAAAPVGRGVTARASGAFMAMPLAENPGALTLAEASADPRQSNVRNAETRAGKTSTHAQASVGADGARGRLRADVRAWGLARRVDNPLSFGYVGLKRRAGGLHAGVQRAGARFSAGAGLDAGAQSDERTNAANVLGEPGPERTLDQRERVTNAAAFGWARAAVGRAGLEAGARFDRVRFAARDRLLANGDASGARTFHAVSPRVGGTLALGRALAFANVSTAFETPTTTELANRPDLAGGFNPDLAPQRTTGAEAGLRGELRRLRLAYDVAVYASRVRDPLVPFTTEAGGDRTFYRNEGAATTRGAEAGATLRAGRAFEATLAYTYTRGRFEGGAFDGRRVPGVPAHVARLRVEGAAGPAWLAASAEALGGYPADDANAARTDGYAALDLHAGLRAVRVGRATLAPFASLLNVTDARYNGSVVVNATGARYFEPAPGRAATFGLRVALGGGGPAF